MTNLMWILANCVLLLAAYGVTVWVRDYEPPASWNARASQQAEGRNQGRPQARQSDGVDTVADARLRGEEFDDLWKNTLFRPERTEEVASAEEGEEEEKAPEQVQMELIGVGKIGDKPVAIILEKTPARRAIRRLTRGPRLPGAQPEEDANAPAKTQHIYREGQEVGDSGYTVRKIGFHEVLLTRGEEELTLKLEAGDDQSQSRRDKAVASAKAQEAKQEAQDAQEEVARKTAAAASGAPPPPPPPPVAAPSLPVPDGKKPSPTAASSAKGTAEAGNTSAMSREERLKRARLLRERILQRRQEQQEQTN